MSWPVHEDVPPFQLHWDKHPRIKQMLNALTIVTRKHRRIIIVLLLAVFLGGVVTLGPKIKNSIIHTFERSGRSAALQGHSLTETTQPMIKKFLSWIQGLSQRLN
jgi:hypothetical protein